MKYFLKNISDSAIRVRSMGEKISAQAGEIFEVTGEEFENHTTLYPKFFEQTFEEKEEKNDETPAKKKTPAKKVQSTE